MYEARKICNFLLSRYDARRFELTNLRINKLLYFIHAESLAQKPDEHVRVLTRGVYELHCVDDPNDPVPLIVDLSEAKIGDGRRLRVHQMEMADSITLEQFDRVVREFVKALKLAGVAVPSEADAANIVDFFKKK